MRPWECPQTDRHTHRHTDANRFYNLSHAICYSYGTDNKCPVPGIKPDTVAHLSTNRVRRRLTSLIEANALTTTPDHHRSPVGGQGYLTRNMTYPISSFYLWLLYYLPPPKRRKISVKWLVSWYSELNYERQCWPLLSTRSSPTAETARFWGHYAFQRHWFWCQMKAHMRPHISD